MQKIISLFVRNYDGDRLVRDEIVPGAEWVVAGEGSPTRKWDGSSCLIRDGRLFKRYDAKKGKLPPEGFEPLQESADMVTGHFPGWVPVKNAPNDRWHREAFAEFGAWDDGTYELVGPRVNGGKENMPTHILIPHGIHLLQDVPTDFVGIRRWLEDYAIEGIVWHHPDGRMVKIKRRDFGLPWPPRGGTT